MHLPTIATLFLATLTAAAPPTTLSKRCRMGYSLRPCWVYWDDLNCEVYIPLGVTYAFDDAAKQVTISGLCDSCSKALAREEISVRTDTWATSFGPVRDLGNGTFVIKDTGDERSHFSILRSLKPNPGEYGDSCRGLEDW